MPENTDDLGDDTLVWQGVLDPSLLNDHAVSAGHRLADAAKAGDWSTVMRLLDKPGHQANVNQWRPGGPAWFTPLHQAAWHGAPTEVAAELIRGGHCGRCETPGDATPTRSGWPETPRDTPRTRLSRSVRAPSSSGKAISGRRRHGWS